MFSNHYYQIFALYRSNWNNNHNQQVLEKVLSEVTTVNKRFKIEQIKGIFALYTTYQESMKEHACQVTSQSKFIEINHQLLLNSFHIRKLFYLTIEIVSENIRKLLKMRNVIWIVMGLSCMLLFHLWWLMGSCTYILTSHCMAL